MNLRVTAKDGTQIEGVWAKITEINGDLIKGIIENDGDWEIIDDVNIEFDICSIIRLRGDLSWTIDNLVVNVSQEVIDGAEVGYFYNSFNENPLNYGRSFYSVNEINKVKYTIETIEYPLKELCNREPNLVNVLEDFAYCGVIKDSNGNFKILNDNDIIDEDRSVFPCFYELDTNELYEEVVFSNNTKMVDYKKYFGRKVTIKTDDNKIHYTIVWGLDYSFKDEDEITGVNTSNGDFSTSHIAEITFDKEDLSYILSRRETEKLISEISCETLDILNHEKNKHNDWTLKSVRNKEFDLSMHLEKLKRLENIFLNIADKKDPDFDFWRFKNDHPELLSAIVESMNYVEEMNKKD